MPLIVIGLIAWVVTKAITDGRIDHTYARQGLVSPRMQAKYGSDRAARQATAGYGLLGHIRAAWRDYWPRRTQALIAARDAKAANPGEPVSWRDRWAAATKTLADVGRKLVEPVPTRAERQAVEVAEEKPAEPAPALAVDTGDVPVGTIRHTDDGREQWTGSAWEPVPEPTNADDDDSEGTAMPADAAIQIRQMLGRCAAQDRNAPHDDAGFCSSDAAPGDIYCAHHRRMSVAGLKGAPAQTRNADTAIAGGTTMTSPGGFEATNFETAVPALDALTQAAQNLSDHVAGAEAAAAQFNDQIEEIEQARDDVARAATLVMEQLAARNLDADTMGQVTAAMEQIRAGDLSKAMDYIDAAMTSLSGAKTAAAEASGAAAAASATVVSKYGDAASTVASELSGDASFLHSGGSTSGGAGGGAGVRVFDGPVDARGQHLGQGGVHNGESGATASSSGGGGNRGGTVNNVFAAPVSADGAHSGTGDITNNWASTGS